MSTARRVMAALMGAAQVAIASAVSPEQSRSESATEKLPFVLCTLGATFILGCLIAPRIKEPEPELKPELEPEIQHRSWQPGITKKGQTHLDELYKNPDHFSGSEIALRHGRVKHRYRN